MSHPAPNPLPDKPALGLYGGCVLFAAPRRWDEACFATPALRAIRAARPTCSLGLICHEEQADYWTTVPGLNQIIVYGNRTRLRELLKAQENSRYPWDAAILWEKDLPAEFCKALAVKQRLGYAKKPLLKFLTDPVPLDDTPGPVTHRVRFYLDFMECLKIPTQKPEIFTPCPLDVARSSHHVIVHPASDYGPSHEWTSEGWEQTLHWLLHHGNANVTLLQTASSPHSLATTLAQRFPQARLESLPHFAAALPLLGSASLTISADSSLCHLSAHVGTPTLSLFGPNDPEWRRPLGKQHRVIRQKVECSPCLLEKCPLDRRCQNELSAATLIDALQTLMR
jgi:ADP-heptose:LPS heptosyltransferase